MARAFDDLEVMDVVPALEPMVESDSAQALTASLRFGLGTPPVRLLLVSPDERWVFQLQQDRIAVHERKRPARPSFKNVRPKLEEWTKRASAALGRELLGENHPAEIAEVVYENHIPTGNGWSGFSELDRVLRPLASTAGDEPFAAPEQSSLTLTYKLTDDEEFRGRLRVVAEPAGGGERQESLHLRLIDRRFVQNRDLAVVLEECHADIVSAFTAITTDDMHKIWERYQ